MDVETTLKIECTVFSNETWQYIVNTALRTVN